MEFEKLGAEEALRQALDSVGKPGRVTVCGPPDEVDMLQEFAEDDERPPRAILESARGIDAAGWLRAREVAIRGDRAGEDEEEGWPGALDSGGFALNTNVLTGELHPAVAVARLHVDAPWEIPAHLRFGGWNECPLPEEHCAVWRHWHEKYGAHIVGMSHDTVEAAVERPPTTPEEAVRLAWEQYVYCPDVVDQGVGSVANLAGGLFGGRTWYFWWD